MIIMLFIIPLIAVILISLPLVPVYRGIVTGKKAKTAILFNICGFIGICIISIILPIGGFVSAEGTAEVVSETVASSGGMKYIAAAISTGLAALGAGIAVAAAAPAAIGAFSEDQKNFGKALIFVALGEGVAIYGLLISILIIMI